MSAIKEFLKKHIEKGFRVNALFLGIFAILMASVMSWAFAPPKNFIQVGVVLHFFASMVGGLVYWCERLSARLDLLEEEQAPVEFLREVPTKMEVRAFNDGDSLEDSPWEPASDGPIISSKRYIQVRIAMEEE